LKTVKTVLIVDDSSFSRDVIKEILSKCSVEIIGEAENGTRGVEKYAELKPDIVIMDLMMEEENGMEALKRILETDPEAAVVMVSAAAGQDVIADEARAAGARMVFKKPLDRKLFIEYINAFTA
jgi:two-component system chemotaxis response regulator CheY